MKTATELPSLVSSLEPRTKSADLKRRLGPEEKQKQDETGVDQKNLTNKLLGNTGHINDDGC